MAWVRIDDQAPRNEKMLRAGAAACWLWVCGIAHAQSQLTDGFISETALPMIGVTKDAKKLAERLVEVGLFDRADGGYVVHDYLDHNPSRVDVLAKRAADAERKRAAESARNPVGVADGGDAESSAPRAGVPSQPIRSVPIHPGSRRPQKFGRITLHRWMLDQLVDNLGPHAESFGLDEWVYSLSAKATAQRQVLIGDSLWPWVQGEFKAECERRGLTVAGEHTATEADRLAKVQAAIAEMDAAAGRRR